ncbi:hypothetical protein FACS189474_0780 [Bacteroidia bacterium]|nr:hypothetical protein FACS189474_0780 [Bacteroidia bacterium]
MNFQCSWDGTVIGITISVIILLVALFIACFFAVKKHEKPKYQMIILIIVVIGTLVCMGVSGLYTPLNVSIQNQSISIHQLKGNTIIPIADIQEIRRCTEFDTKNSRKTFGGDGFFGDLGIFNNAQLGKYKMYVTNHSDRILVKTNEETIIFSCDNPDELINIINTMH